MNIIESYAMLKPMQIKFPRKKTNRRWQKKYKKKYSVQVPRTDFMVSVSSNTIICHPMATSRLRIANQNLSKEFGRNAIFM